VNYKKKKKVPLYETPCRISKLQQIGISWWTAERYTIIHEWP